MFTHRCHELAAHWCMIVAARNAYDKLWPVGGVNDDCDDDDDDDAGIDFGKVFGGTTTRGTCTGSGTPGGSTTRGRCTGCDAVCTVVSFK